MKVNSCAANDLDTYSNATNNTIAGDIVVHTVDNANGNPAKGVANVLFKLPAGDDGRYQISGSVWDAATDASRPQDWVLLVNGVKKASGALSGTVLRKQAHTFNTTVNLIAGDTVELELIEDPNSPFSFFVGASMTIQPMQSECMLTDLLTYNATTGTLTMKFSVATPATATWNAWITVHNSLELLWSKTLPAIETPVTKTETHEEAKSGEIGILSTLTTPAAGITCSNWQTINTGTP